jgi:asparagine synthetase B (glutamine-hydrolysing)
MCGFGAEVRPAGAVDRTALAAMGDALAPRGPDGEGERVAGLSIVFNGCIYN